MDEINNILVANETLDGLGVALDKAASIEHYTGAEITVADAIYNHILRAFGRFERLIPLPGPVHADKACARYRRGVLKVTLPKSAKPSEHRIKVTSG